MVEVGTVTEFRQIISMLVYVVCYVSKLCLHHTFLIIRTQKQLCYVPVISKSMRIKGWFTVYEIFLFSAALSALSS